MSTVSNVYQRRSFSKTSREFFTPKIVNNIMRLWDSHIKRVNNKHLQLALDFPKYKNRENYEIFQKGRNHLLDL